MCFVKYTFCECVRKVIGIRKILRNTFLNWLNLNSEVFGEFFLIFQVPSMPRKKTEKLSPCLNQVFGLNLLKIANSDGFKYIIKDDDATEFASFTSSSTYPLQRKAAQHIHLLAVIIIFQSCSISFKFLILVVRKAAFRISPSEKESLLLHGLNLKFSLAMLSTIYFQQYLALTRRLLWFISSTTIIYVERQHFFRYCFFLNN